MGKDDGDGEWKRDGNEDKTGNGKGGPWMVYADIKRVHGTGCLGFEAQGVRYGGVGGVGVCMSDLRAQVSCIDRNVETAYLTSWTGNEFLDCLGGKTDHVMLCTL